ncbi:MAG: hypothetical protein QNJ57_00080 [Flavobacteriaceae bacterium]|nr:hypothetical protein [Flavobacteriaceae bacterium]
MFSKKWLFIVFILIGVFTAVSQEKFEREYRVDTDEVPLKAKTFIEKCRFSKQVKWYVEESQDGKTYEAKSVKKGYKFSIEFDLQGTVLDVEKTVKLTEISSAKIKKIESALTERFRKYKIKKIQVQWKTDTNSYIALINGDVKVSTNELYELVVKGKVVSHFKMYELLINPEGTILKELEIVPANSDNLQF